MKFKPTVFVGIGDSGCDIVELAYKRIKESRPNYSQITRALGITFASSNKTKRRSFHVENLSGFVPTKVAQRSNRENREDPLFGLISTSERIV